MPKKRFKVKNLVTRNIHGRITNYGPLMVGYLNGIECLAHREVLLLLGIKLSHGVRQPRDFYNELQLRVAVAGIEVVIYATRRVTIDALGCQLSKRGFPVFALVEWSQDPVKRWKDGELIEDKFPIVLPTRTKKDEEWGELYLGSKTISPLRKFWLSIKRLFSRKEEFN